MLSDAHLSPISKSVPLSLLILPILEALFVKGLVDRLSRIETLISTVACSIFSDCFYSISVVVSCAEQQLDKQLGRRLKLPPLFTTQLKINKMNKQTLLNQT